MLDVNKNIFHSILLELKRLHFHIFSFGLSLRILKNILKNEWNIKISESYIYEFIQEPLKCFQFFVFSLQQNLRSISQPYPTSFKELVEKMVSISKIRFLFWLLLCMLVAKKEFINGYWRGITFRKKQCKRINIKVSFFF